MGNDTTFGDYLRFLRRRARLTQTELSIAVGYSDAQISRLEKGHRQPDLTTLIALFLPALDIDSRSEEAKRLLELAAASVVPTPRISDTTAVITPPGTTPSHLPLPSTPLIGRQSERAALSRLLTDGSTRLVTLLGTAGIGKTRLAVQVAHDLHARFAGGAYFVDLSAVNDPALVATVVAQALEISEEGYESATAAVEATVRDKQLLLVLDNVEQVRDAATLIKRWLAVAPHMVVVVTSRIALRLTDETTYPVRPLAIPTLAALPPLEELAQVESVALLLARLRAGTPDLILNAVNALPIAALCVRVDGVPLAIELIAAHGRLFTPQELLVEIAHQFTHLRRRGRDVPTRHQTVPTALAWSYTQLSDTEQQLFAGLSVFVNGWTVEGAVAIGAALRLARTEVLDGLENLLDHSLIQRQSSDTTTRLVMLTMIRGYAYERIVDFDALRRAMLYHYVSMAEEAETILIRGNDHTVIRRLELEQDNLRTALEWAMTHDVEAGVRLAGALWRFWYYRGYLREGRQWLERLTTLAGVEIAAEVRAHALDGIGVLAWRQSDYRQAEAAYDAALALYQRTDNTRGSAKVLGHIGLLHSERGNPDLARTTYQQSLPLYRALGDEVGVVTVLHNLGNLATQQGDNAQARLYYEECLEIYGRAGDTVSRALVLLGLGTLTRDDGNIAQAIAEFTESFELATAHGDDWGAATARINLGDLATDLNDFGGAEAHYILAFQMFEQMGDQQSLASVQVRHGFMEWIRGNRAAAVRLFRQSLLLANAIGFQPSIAESLDGLAGCVTAHQPRLAVKLFAVADALRTSVGFPIPIADRPRYERMLAAARRGLDTETWAALWAEGQVLSVAEAVSLALTNGS